MRRVLLGLIGVMLVALGVMAHAQISYPPPDLSLYATSSAMTNALTGYVPTATFSASQCKWVYVAGTSTTFGNTTTETSIATTPAFGTLTVPACATGAGFTVQIHVDGQYQAATVAPGTLTQTIKFNGVPVCRVVLGNLATTGATGLGAHGNAFIKVSPTGAVTCTGFLGYQTTATMEAPGYWTTVGTPTITPGSTILIDYTGQWSSANAANSITATAVIGTLNR